jgi:DNA-binding transcriptional LysR family regulator
MHIENLKVFCDLAETGSFTRTAEINSVTQSAVSQTISNMERQFHALLAERSRKNFRLTREGEIVYDYSRQLLQAFANLEARLQEAKEVASGQIRLAAIHSLGLHNLLP